MSFFFLDFPVHFVFFFKSIFSWVTLDTKKNLKKKQNLLFRKMSLPSFNQKQAMATNNLKENADDSTGKFKFFLAFFIPLFMLKV